MQNYISKKGGKMKCMQPLQCLYYHETNNALIYCTSYMYNVKLGILTHCTVRLTVYNVKLGILTHCTSNTSNVKLGICFCLFVFSSLVY